MPTDACQKDPAERPGAVTGSVGSGRWRWWLSRGVWTTGEHVLFALGNVLAGILLARMLNAREYGAFSTAYSMFLLLGAAYTALWLDPLLVYASGTMRGALGEYFRVLRKGHWLYCLVGAMVLLVIAFVWNLAEPGMGKSLAMAGLSAPGMLYAWFARRCCYVLDSARLAAIFSCFYLFVMCALLAILAWIGWLDAGNALLVMGGVSWLCGAALLVRLEALLPREGGEISMQQVVGLHLGYGRWALLASLLGWVPVNIYYVLLPWFGGLAASADLRAVLTLVMPALHFNTAMSAICIPQFVRAVEAGRLLRVVHVALAGMIGSMLVFWCILQGAGEVLMHTIYADRYGAELLGWAALLPVPAVIITTCAGALKAMDCPRLLPGVYAYGAGISLAGGTLALACWQARGAVMAIVLTHCCMGGIMYARMLRAAKTGRATGYGRDV